MVDPIRELLRGLEPSWSEGPASETLDFPESRVVEAGGDPDAVAQWVQDQGGYVNRDANKRRGYGPRHGETVLGEVIYVVPREALQAS